MKALLAILATACFVVGACLTSSCTLTIDPATGSPTISADPATVEAISAAALQKINEGLINATK